MSNEQVIEDAKTCDQRDIDYSQDEMGFKLADVTRLLPEAPYPSLVSERLDGELRASGDYNGQVWDLFFMSGCSPNRVRENYNVYFSLVLNGREQIACVTQCGGSYTEDYFVFALAGENIYYGHDIENPEVRALVEGISREAPLPSRSLETGPFSFSRKENQMKLHTCDKTEKTCSILQASIEMEHLKAAGKEGSRVYKALDARCKAWKKRADAEIAETKDEVDDFFNNVLPNMTPAERAAYNKRLKNAAAIYRSGDKAAIARLERSLR